jgi:hypothetical protein
MTVRPTRQRSSRSLTPFFPILLGVLVTAGTVPAGAQGERSVANAELQKRLAETRVWAAHELSTLRDDLPAPHSRKPVVNRTETSASGVVRLLPLVSDATVKTDWVSSDSRAPAALTIRDRSLSEPGAMGTKTTFEGKDAQSYDALRIAGLDISAEDIGEIQLTADFGDANAFVMAWSKQGEPLATRPLDSRWADDVPHQHGGAGRLEGESRNVRSACPRQAVGRPCTQLLRRPRGPDAVEHARSCSKSA